MASFSAIKIKPLVEFLIIAFAVASIPIAVQSISISMHRPNTLVQIISTFMIILIGFHGYFIRRRKITSPKLIKSLDYIYLIVVAFGLFQVTELTKSRLRHDYDEATVSSTNKLIDLLDHENHSVGHYCEIMRDRANQCSEHRLMVAAIKEEIGNIPSNGPLSAVHMAIMRLHNRVAKSAFMEITDKNYYKIVDDIVSYNNENNPDPDTQFLPDFNREQGYLFVASALALRITRVTVEILHLHRKAV